MDKISFAIEDFKNIQELIRFIDQKAGALLVIHGFVFTAFFEYAKTLILINPFMLFGIRQILFSIAVFVTGILYVSFFLYQVFHLLFRVIGPKYDSNYLNGESCLYYFKHISSSAKDDFINRFKNLTDDAMLDEILGQIYEVSGIICKKSEQFCWAIRYLFANLFLLLLFIILVKSL